MTGRLPALALAVALAAASCVHAPPRREVDVDVTPPADWTAAETVDGEPLDAWWTTFDDPALVRIVEEALAHNTDLVAATARVDRVLAEARIAGADLKPAVGVGLRAARQRQVFVGFPFGGSGVPSVTYSSYGVSLDVSWEVDLWGRLRAGARAALADAQAASADLAGARLSIAGQVAKAWFAAGEARRQVDMARASAASLRRLAEQIRRRYEAGTRPAVDLRLALSNASAAEAQVDARRQALDGAVRQLEVLLGRYPAASLLDGHAVPEDPAVPPPVPAGLPAEIVARRPDLLAAERRVVASDQRLAAARRSLYPRLTLTATGGTATDAFSDLLDGDFKTWSVVGNLLQPLFQGGRLRAGVDRAAAGTDEALAAYAGTALRAYAEVETALAAESLLAGREAKQADVVEQLVAAERLAEDRYARGVGDYLTVLEAQTRSFTARSTLLALRRQRLDNRVDLHLALGGGFDVAPPDGTVAAAAATPDDDTDLATRRDR